MSEDEVWNLEDRILVFTPTGRDAALACQLLAGADLPCLSCPDETAMCREIEAGAGAAILAEEALLPWTVNALREVLRRQGPWSDLPLIVFTRASETNEEILETLGPLSNATILERPVRMSTLLSLAKTALRARRRQYEVRDLLLRQNEADRRKDEFLAMLGHELRNPLAAIRNSLWVLDEVGARGDQDLRQREVIERQTRHLVRMVDDLLDVSRVTLGKIILKRQTVDLEEIIARCLHELGLAALAASHGLTLRVETEPVVVDGDPVRLEQVICNLVQNAIKYTPRGGRLTLTVRAEGNQGTIRMRDTGVGITAEMLPQIFEPFTQVESSRMRSEGGLGLGLPLVRGLVELHGGRVEAQSDGPGQGSEFIVRFPLRTGKKPARRSASPCQSTANGAEKVGLSILVVEDNMDGRESLRDLLEIWGHRVDLAENGHEGVEQALAVRPDVALIDIGLPGMDGNEVARRIRTAFGADPLVLIAMTGYGQPDDRRRALQAGFDSYLVKPVDPAYLSRLLGEVGQQIRRREVSSL
jgi:signal transduction histidine kinase/ActR/RegA family two-component response regulator